MTTAILSIVVLAVAVGLLAVRILFVSDGEFRGTCASNNPYLPELKKANGDCWACGKPADDECEYVEPRAVTSGEKSGCVPDR